MFVWFTPMWIDELGYSTKSIAKCPLGEEAGDISAQLFPSVKSITIPTPVLVIVFRTTLSFSFFLCLS